ncbi:MAG: helix-turn-helix transcriptional regulator [Deltaproteobacteria bacterium]|nr:helix-turn-helix transcriptional regulator [Deltaproteobacteria bacterium]
MTLGERIKTIRQSFRWTQDRLAQEAEISKSFLSEIENDKANISGEKLLKIAIVLNTSLDYLMKGYPDPSDKKPRTIEIPPELSDYAEEIELSYKSTLDLLSAHQSLVARRSNKKKLDMTKESWRDLYERLKIYLE